VRTTADPRPAQLPLPGGRPDAHVRLRPLLTGDFATPPGYLARPSGRFAGVRGLGLFHRRKGWSQAPVPAFLVEHPAAGPILVDTGLHESILTSRRNMGALGRIVRFQTNEGQSVVRQLAERGLEPHHVRTIVMTHLHLDHASAVEDFPDSTFVVSRQEWEAATRPRAQRDLYVRGQFDRPFAWRTVDFDAPGVDSFATFGRTIDLFGDGSVRLLSTPGHTAGHMSLLLRLRHREVLLIGDAAFTWHTIKESARPLLLQDVHRFRRSLGEIQRYVAQTPGALVIPGHDATAWAELDPVYV
jgi:glyoxylase-like metal-dependent hydrolase (beta-lactamase superfamily II)